MPLGWRFRVVGVTGMKEINSTIDTAYISTETTEDTVTINQVNSLFYGTYSSGGIIEYNQPVDLEFYSARMQIRETVDSTEAIYSATSEDSSHLVVDNTQKTIRVRIPASVTQSFDFSTAVYSVELYTGAGFVVPFIAGNLTLVPEVTR
jgi:hypothetical protein